MMDIEILVRADSAISSYGIAENDMSQDQSLREESSWKYSRRKIIRNLIVVSICSTLVQSVRKESSQNEASIEILQFAQKQFPGLKIDQIFTSIINFLLIFLNSIAIPQITISKLSSKYAMLISLVSYFVSTAANLFNSSCLTFFALLLNQIFGNLIFVGALVYVKQISTIYSRHSYESDLKIFFLFYLSFFSFNLTSYFWSKLIYCEILTLIKSWVILNLCIMFMLVMAFILSASSMDNYVDLQERQLKYLLVNWTHLKDKQQLLILPITFYLGGFRAFFEKNLKISIENSIAEVQSACVICLFSLAGLAAFVVITYLIIYSPISRFIQHRVNALGNKCVCVLCVPLYEEFVY
ncbi:hypothetical protein BpHYR1_023738 [Brachionus plicatilis]|uniref:Uncharacterized protein n=1 Tax=Brachionus plicatilis TaxID=10195 RepID=A0A3M7RQH3_BRAPC|nr:hypothetical protein BpHYR1_023738 [Brachionus plicatilis]